MGLASSALVLIASAPLWASAASDLSVQIRSAKLDSARCYRVRDLGFAREDLKIFLNNGYLIFSQPVAGAPFAAVFSGEIQGGDGEVLVTPPRRSERRSLASFADSPTLNTHFQTALFLFTDGTARELIDLAVAQGSPSNEMGLMLAGKYSPTLRNIAQGFEVRLMADVLNANPARGFFYATVGSNTLGTLDLVYDPTAHDQIVIGQYSTTNNHPIFDVWTSFQSRTGRTGAAVEADRTPYELSDFRIEATVENDFSLSARTRVTVRLKDPNLRALPFEISGQMEVDEARIDGKPAEVFRRESARESAFRPSENNVFLAVPSEPLDSAVAHEAEFRHHGRVIRTNASKVFFVSSRTNWYPNQGNGFATYDMTFRHPKSLDLVTNGEFVSSVIEGDQRVTRRKTSAPIRFAGFNLGEYQCVQRRRTDGFRLDVCGSRNLDPALKPRIRDTSVFDAGMPRLGGRGGVPPVVAPPLPDPLAKLNRLAATVEDAFDFMSSRYGPPPLKNLTVTPIPGTFGQGFPGLIYLATASYLDVADLPQTLRDAGLASFYIDLLAAHEMAHQWWGNLVAAQTYKDNWLQESLANYAALLYLEKRKGSRAVAAMLEEYRRHLLAKGADGNRVESAGPVTFGTRLSSSKNPDAWQVITYEKGSWILHMLRTEMGDAQFAKLLTELPKRFTRRPLSTEDFRLLAAEFMPAKSRDPKLEAFFENWVYSTGVPALKLSASVKGTRLNGTLAQSGVAKDFEVDVPIEVTSPGRTAVPLVYWIRSSSEPVEFSLVVPVGSTKAQIGAAFLQAK